jgi:hypothetical protein
MGVREEEGIVEFLLVVIKRALLSSLSWRPYNMIKTTHAL